MAKHCKLFVGRLNKETTTDGLRQHFGQYGTLSDCAVVMDEQLVRSRRFGFITYSKPEEADAAMAVEHVIDGSNVEVKRAIARGDANHPTTVANVKKVFVGGVKEHIEAENLIEYFSQFGTVEKAEIKTDRDTGQKRGFGFVFFEDPESASKAAMTNYHTISGTKVEVKKAVTRLETDRGRGRGRGMSNYGGGRGSGGYGRNYGRGGGYGYGGDGGAYGGYEDYNNQMGDDYSNGDFGEGYGQQHSNYGAMKRGNNYSSRPPYFRARGGDYGGYGGGY